MSDPSASPFTGWGAFVVQGQRVRSCDVSAGRFTPGRPSTMTHFPPPRFLTRVVVSAIVTGMTTELLGTAAAAEAIGIERSTLSRWVASGRMTPHMQLAGRTGAMLFTRSEVDRVAAAYQANDAA